MEKQKEIERLKTLTYTDIYYEMEALKNTITKLNQALQLQQTGVSGSKCSRKCKECNKLLFDCSDFCSKRCENTYYR